MVGRPRLGGGALIPEPEEREVAVRAFAVPRKRPVRGRRPRRQVAELPPSEWALVLDTETTTDPAQRLRFGAYQVRRSGELLEEGLFVDREALDAEELALVERYAAKEKLRVLTVEAFVDEVFYPLIWERGAVCVGFNLPFDLSRLARAHAPAKGAMRGGFSFTLSPDPKRPRVQVKHLNSREALVRFRVEAEQRTKRSLRGRGAAVPPRRGHFVDVRTLAGALFSEAHDLRSLAEFLGTPDRKLGTDEHGERLRRAYLVYARNDVQVTWECYAELRRRYAEFGLSLPVSRVYSEASLGKALLREMGVRPWRERQPDFGDELLGILVSTYYGGRSEVRLRRVVREVLYCDFRSMYPTVSTLAGLWRFVTAERLDVVDETDDVRRFLASVTVEDLRRPEAWRLLTAIVQVLPEGGVFPVRARYDERDLTIGLNYLTSARPLWFTLADCVAAKLEGRKVPKVVRALRFVVREPQPTMRPLNVLGREAYRVDPYADDLYRKLVDLRAEVRREAETAKRAADVLRAAQLDAEQQRLKILVNATAYGIFVELNVRAYAKERKLLCYGPDGRAFVAEASRVEQPGPFFHPLVATLTTAGARLMLALAERLALDQGLEWVFCDTDSLALARPKRMGRAEFRRRAKTVQEWFTGLNPYVDKGSLFRIEDANHALDGSGRLEPLFAFAVSDKRYVLFNLGHDRRPVLRKASAHGLGHLRPPYGDEEAPKTMPAPKVSLAELGVRRWQHDLWHRIVCAALDGHPDQVDLSGLPGVGKPAMSRYAATTPELLDWFRAFNAARGRYADQVRPFGFLSVFQSKRRLDLALKDRPAIVAPYDRDPTRSAGLAFDRRTQRPVPLTKLATYREVLTQYHLREEAKFHNGGAYDAGPTERRHVRVAQVVHIGKEADRWEEQQRVAAAQPDDTAVVYGPSTADRRRASEALRRAIRRLGIRRVARLADCPPATVHKFVHGSEARPRTRSRLEVAVAQLTSGHASEDARSSKRPLGPSRGRYAGASASPSSPRRPATPTPDRRPLGRRRRSVAREG